MLGEHDFEVVVNNDRDRQAPETGDDDDTDDPTEIAKPADDDDEQDTGKTDGETETDDALRQTIESFRQKEAETLNQLVRAQAELENVRKRAQRQIEEAHRYALMQFVHALLPVIDSLELGIVAARDATEVGGVLEGMELTSKAFLTALEKSGVVAVDPTEGDKFDVNEHEAMTMQKAAGVEPNTIVNILQKGYKLNGRLLRPARVIVAK